MILPALARSNPWPARAARLFGSALLLGALLLAGCARRPMMERYVSVYSLYSRMGGHERIAAIVNSALDGIQEDPELDLAAAAERATSQPTAQCYDGMRERLTEYLCVAAGGPETYPGLTLNTVHKNMGITAEQFTRFVEHFRNAASAQGLDAPMLDDFLVLLSRTAPQVESGVVEQATDPDPDYGRTLDRWVDGASVAVETAPVATKIILAQRLVQRARPDDLQRACEILQPIVAADQSDLRPAAAARRRLLLAEALLHLGQAHEAEEVLRTALRAFGSINSEEADPDGVLTERLVQLLFVEGRAYQKCWDNEAADMAGLVIRVPSVNFLADSGYVGRHLIATARFLREAKRLAPAQAFAHAAIAVLAHEKKTNWPYWGYSRETWLGRAYGELDVACLAGHQFAEAEAAALRSYKLRAAHLAADDPELAEARQAIVSVYEAWNIAEPDQGHAERASQWQVDGAASSAPSVR